MKKHQKSESLSFRLSSFCIYKGKGKKSEFQTFESEFQILNINFSGLKRRLFSLKSPLPNNPCFKIKKPLRSYLSQGKRFV